MRRVHALDVEAGVGLGVAQGLRLSVRLDLQATPSVEQALIKGVPMYFVWRADVIRDRWYWTDKRIRLPPCPILFTG